MSSCESPLPRDVWRALNHMKGELSRAFRLHELAAVAGVAPRTLQKNFRRFLGRTPRVMLQELRLEAARRALLAAAADVGVTRIARTCGFTHLGRFAIDYRRRYEEAPSETLRRRAEALGWNPWR